RSRRPRRRAGHRRRRRRPRRGSGSPPRRPQCAGRSLTDLQVVVVPIAPDVAVALLLGAVRGPHLLAARAAVESLPRARTLPERIAVSLARLILLLRLVAAGLCPLGVPLLRRANVLGVQLVAALPFGAAKLLVIPGAGLAALAEAVLAIVAAAVLGAHP